MKKNKHPINHSMNIELYKNGMPCHKYLLRSLKNSDEAQCFVKTYVNTLSYIKISDRDIEDSLNLLPLSIEKNSPISTYDFTNWPHMLFGVSLLDNIRMDRTVNTYKRCTQFYKTKAPKMEACKLCPLSKRYCNAKSKEELMVLRYSLSSIENYNYICSLGINDSHFNSVVDVLEYSALAEKPGLYPFYHNTFKALNNASINAEWFADTSTEICESMLNYHLAELKRNIIPNHLEINDYSRKVIAVLWDTILIAPICSKEEISQYVASLLPGPEETNEQADYTQITVAADLGVNNIEDFYFSIPIVDAPREKKKRKEEPSFEYITLESILNELDSKEMTYEEKDTSYEVPAPKAKKDKFSVSDANDSVDMKPTDDEPSKKEGLNRSMEKCPASSDGKEDFHAEKIIHNNTNGEIELREIGNAYDEEKVVYDEEGSMICIPIVPLDELRHFAIALDNGVPRLLSLFESHVLKDKRLCIELIITDENKKCLLLYSPRLHAYFYTGFVDKRVQDIVSQLLSYASVEKYCYYPFNTISSLCKIGIYPKSITSLFSMSAFLYPHHHMSVEESLLTMGATKAEGGITVKPKGDIKSIPLLYMHSYCSIFHRNKKKLLTSGFMSEFKDRNWFDCILSGSYCQDFYTVKNRHLFSIRDCSNYIFGKVMDNEYKKKGKIHIFTLRNTIDSATIIKELLCKLDEKGYIKKYNLLLTSLSATSFSMFVPEHVAADALTTINTTLLFYLKEQNQKNVELEVTLAI